MNEAFQELERVKEEIAQLKKVRDDAQRQIIAAKLEVAKSKHAAQPASSSAAAAAAAAATSTAPSYSSKEYWTERYNPTPSSTLAGVDAAVYEWYASYAVLSKLISASIERCSDRTSASLFLPGCGNSELGECIAADHPGKRVVAVDFDPQVVAVMQGRANERSLANLAYREGDLLSLTNERTSDYDVVLDKGTLDAIASGGDEAPGATGKATESKSTSVARYCLEMWRILCIGGQFAIVTTMPPHVLETLAIVPIESSAGGSDGDDHATDWKRGNIVTTLQTEAGGTVYYYSIMKLKHSVDRKQSVVSAFINAIQEAKEGEEWAELEREAMASQGNDELVQSGPLERIVSAEQAAQILECTFQLVIDLYQSRLEPGGTVVAHFSSIGTENAVRSAFCEGDILRLVCTSNAGECHYLPSEQLADAIEYVDEPVVSGQGDSWTSTGCVRMTLPMYAATYYVAYSRAFPRQYIAGVTKTTTEFVELAKSPAFSVRCPVFVGHPDQRPRSAGVPSRRSAKSISDSAVDGLGRVVTVENMRNIKKMSIAVNWREGVSISRLLSWAVKPAAHADNVLFELLLEVDVIIPSAADSPEHPHAEKVITQHVSIVVEDLDMHCTILWQNAFSEVTGSCVNIRLPYQRPAARTTAVASSGLGKVQFDALCGFCRQTLICHDMVHNIHLLPSGLFDESFHDFLCCETADHMSLRVEDLEPAPNSFYCGPVFGLVHSSSVQQAACVLDCKAGQSLCDLFTSMGAGIATSALSLPDGKTKLSKRREALKRAMKAFVNIDTCSVRCNRCDALLGDATLTANPGNPAAEQMASDSASLAFGMSEAEQVRLYWHRIQLKEVDSDLSSLDKSWKWLQSSSSIEQIMGRVCQYIFEKFDASLCCVFPFDESTVLEQTTDKLDMVLLRIVSKDHSAACAGDSTVLRLRPCVKVACYLKDDAVQVMRGTEVRIPLSRDDYDKFRRLLEHAVTASSNSESSGNAWSTVCLYV